VIRKTERVDSLRSIDTQRTDDDERRRNGDRSSGRNDAHLRDGETTDCFLFCEFFVTFAFLFEIGRTVATPV